MLGHTPHIENSANLGELEGYGNLILEDLKVGAKVEWEFGEIFEIVKIGENKVFYKRPHKENIYTDTVDVFLENFKSYKEKTRPQTATMQATQVKEKFSTVFELPINKLVTRPDLFQGRQEAFSQATYDKILREGYQKSQEPIVVWYDSIKDEYIVISGHSRLAAAQELYKQGQKNLSTLNVKEFDGTLEDAIKYATLESNRSGTAEGLLSDVIAYKKTVNTGCNKDCLRNYFKTDNYINSLERLSHLNVEGDFLQNLNDPKQVKILPKLQQYAEWTGDLRKNYGNLITNNHENEIFKFLFLDVKNLLSKDDFQRLIEDKVARIDFDPRYPLNLTRIKQKSNYEINAQASIQILEREIRELQDKRLVKEKKRANKEATDRIKQTIDEELKIINGEILRKLEEVEKIKRDIKIGERSQVDMFSSANIEYTPKVTQSVPQAQPAQSDTQMLIEVIELLLLDADAQEERELNELIEVIYLLDDEGLNGLGDKEDEFSKLRLLVESENYDSVVFGLMLSENYKNEFFEFYGFYPVAYQRFLNWYNEEVLQEEKKVLIPLNTYEINIDGKGITYVPDEITIFKNVTYLKLKNMNLSAGLPTNIGDLWRLLVLDVRDCGLTDFPASFWSLPSLNVLCISYTSAEKKITTENFPNKIKYPTRYYELNFRALRIVLMNGTKKVASHKPQEDDKLILNIIAKKSIQAPVITKAPQPAQNDTQMLIEVIELLLLDADAQETQELNELIEVIYLLD